MPSVNSLHTIRREPQRGGSRKRHYSLRMLVAFEKEIGAEIAREAVALLNALFAVERQAKDVSVAERLELRQKQSVPILAELHRKLLI
jgi:hypothetical protein